MSDCIFCKINSGDVPSFIIYDDEHTRAFLDTNPSVEGHVIIQHKKHGETILDYTSDELRDLFTTVQKTVRAVEKAYNTNILTIGINHGEPTGVHHFHVHIIPRYQSDGGGIMQSVVRGRVVDDLNKVQEKIKSKL